MKVLLAALVAAFFMSGCQTLRAGLPSCQAQLQQLMQAEASAGRFMVGVEQPFPSVRIFVFKDLERAVGIAFAMPGAPLPHEQSGFTLVTACDFNGEQGHLFRAEVVFPTAEANNE